MKNKALPNCTNRLFEWIGAGMMFQIGAIILVTATLGRHNPQLSFNAFTQLGFSTAVVGVIFFTLGAVRLMALRLNGSWIVGPHVRAVCAIFGMFIWGNLFYGIVEIYVNTGDVYLSWGVWDSLLVGEYFSMKRAVMDIRSATPAEQA